ncbi:MAG: lipopolysaccharide biosynthesis protein [Bacteroidales bacterium]|nr:lipopolysaccharide biosynthesis protein [Bacteroidales bacterium]
MTEGTSNYEKNRRIARNTAFLFFRMLLMMFIGLFTSRVILQTLGEADYGTYNAVGGVVSFCAILTVAVSNAVLRFMSYSLGEGDPDKTHRVFSASIIIQAVICLILAVIVESAGLWWLHGHMDIPPGRMGAASMALHCSLGILVLNLMSVPYNAMIISHEKMSAFAVIGIMEALLKLSVAILLMLSSLDKLKTYSLLMLSVAVIVRLTYGAYCTRHFSESRGKIVFDKDIVRQMSGFVGWNFFSSGTGVLTNSGINLMVNKYFGVLVNAARGVTSQVEGTVKPFAMNFLSALNPQLTKSYAEGSKEYSFDLVRKGVKIASVLLLMVSAPIILECDYLLDLWLKKVPVYTASFVRVTLLCIILDLGMNSLRQLIIASGRVKVYCLGIGLLNISSFFATWIAFSNGASPTTSYIILLILQLLVNVFCLYISNKQEGFPVKSFCTAVVLPIVFVAIVSIAVPAVFLVFMRPSFLRLVIVSLTSILLIASLSYTLVLNGNEREFVLGVIKKYINRFLGRP